mgnify:CR=1 FL=1
MIKRILEIIWFIITYPFRLIYYAFKILFLILGALFTGIFTKQKNTKNTKEKFDTKQVGQLLFPDLKADFEDYLTLYKTNKSGFRKKYKKHQKDIEDFTELNLIQSFGDIKQKLGFIDWKGEEDEFEIDHYIEGQVQKEITWTNSNLLRNYISIDKQRDGKFIVKLFQAMDKDLQLLNFRLIFLNMGWDAYIFLPVTQNTFDKLFELAPNQFESANEL